MTWISPFGTFSNIHIDFIHQHEVRGIQLFRDNMKSYYANFRVDSVNFHWSDFDMCHRVAQETIAKQRILHTFLQNVCIMSER